VSRYHHILELPTSASIEDVKTAYRRLAKKYHPDVCKEPDAPKKFLLITEAYEMLTSSRFNAHSHTAPPTQDELRKQARARAAAAAKMKYHAFTQTPYYKNTLALSLLIDLIAILLFGVMVIGASFSAIAYHQPGILAFTIPAGLYGFYAMRNNLLKQGNSKRDYINAIITVCSMPKLHIALLIGINLIVFWNIGMLTLAPFWLMISLYTFTSLLGYFWQQNKPNKLNPIQIIAGPTIVSFLLFINMYFAHNSYKITFRVDTSSTANKSAFLTLDNRSLEEFPHCRFFISYSDTDNKKWAEFEFANGLLGVMVIKNRETH
jgi:hypothetical protein